jgi:stage III sporulation protein AD
MDVFLKAAAGVLIAVVVSLVLSRDGKDFSILVVICVSVMVGVSALSYVEKVLDFIRKLEQMGNLNSQLLAILFKAVGIGLISEITTMICADSGNSALGKMIQILSTAVILWLCIPMFTELMDLISQVLGGI